MGAVTLVALWAVALLVRGAVGQQASRPAVSAEDNAAVEAAPRSVGERDAIVRRSPASQTATTRSALGAVGGGKSSRSGFDASRVALSLGIVLALILVLWWLSRRFFGRTILGRSSRAVQVLSRNVISPRQQLLVVRVGRRVVVVGDSGQQMNALCEITDPQEMSALLGQIQEEKRESAGTGFGALFGRAGGGFAASEDRPPAADVSETEDAQDEPNDGDPREELSGLADKVRLMSRQFRRT